MYDIDHHRSRGIIKIVQYLKYLTHALALSVQWCEPRALIGAPGHHRGDNPTDGALGHDQTYVDAHSDTLQNRWDQWNPLKIPVPLKYRGILNTKDIMTLNITLIKPGNNMD